MRGWPVVGGGGGVGRWRRRVQDVRVGGGHMAVMGEQPTHAALHECKAAMGEQPPHAALHAHFCMLCVRS